MHSIQFVDLDTHKDFTDGEISRIIRECHENAESIIRENIGVLHSCAALLLEKEKIHREEFEALFTTEKEEVAKTNE